ncbi:MAG TPA: peptide chain release factor N(5)-glutamine methyltransferase [Roseiflexaceae bacterium]|nr:peptide chain release factor N(5)-glutamine methyltransferase [Roseiflexaceae bacterium]
MRSTRHCTPTRPRLQPAIAEALAAATRQLRSISPTARLDAELLLAHALGWSRARLLAERNAPLPDPAVAQFHALVTRRLDLEPVAYLIGEREFYGLRFAVDRRVLVLRPETELLIDLALAWAATHPGALQIADIGTGSGCIAVALATHLPQAHISAVDVSCDALDVARANVSAHHLEQRITLIHGDLLEPLAAPIRLIVSNPPYTIMAENEVGVNRHEPAQALDGGADGLVIYRRLLAQAPAVLAADGAVLLEIDARQGDAVHKIAAEAFPQAAIAVHRDLAGHDRVVTVQLS